MQICKWKGEIMYIVKWETRDGRSHEKLFKDWEDAIVETMDLVEQENIERVYPVERRYT